jgi:hypothetical protein
MFKDNKKYLYIFIGLFILIVTFQYLLPQPINWRRSYLSKDKAPFGCYALYNLLDGTYSQKFTLNNQTLYNQNEKSDSGSSLLIINDNFKSNKSDVRSLFGLLEKGNTIFIAANRFDGPLADTFHLRTGYGYFSNYLSIDSMVIKPGENIELCAKNFSKKTYQYSQIAWISSFENFDTAKFRVIATTQKNACLIKTTYGKGQLYLMTAPDVFANYFIVNHKNRELAYTMLSLLKNKELIWDEYYKTYNVKNTSFLKFIFGSDALYAAYLLLVLSIIIYMITEGRRRQRSIPVLEPVTNSTLEFVNVISHVYYNSHNHQSIAVERIKYFYETIRKKFNVSTNQINDIFINEISEISGIEFKKVNQLFVYCEKIKKNHEISEYDLIELNRQIANFNKNSLR